MHPYLKKGILDALPEIIKAVEKENPIRIKQLSSSTIHSASILQNKPAIDFANVAKSCNYRFIKTVDNEIDLDKAIKNMKSVKGPALLVIKVKKGARSDLKRPDKLPIEYKRYFMKKVVA